MYSVWLLCDFVIVAVGVFMGETFFLEDTTLRFQISDVVLLGWQAVIQM